ncbi:MAG: hypothetical protein Q8N08_01310 [Methanobacteriaceae archaeon]|nr:hypothetical protein [Methanobacteriaceae archaeon]
MDWKSLEGTKLNEGYSLVRFIDSGYKGGTFLAYDSLGGKCALKLVSIDEYENKPWLREAMKVADLRENENIAKLYDANETEIEIEKGSTQKFAYFSTEFINGITLKQFINEKIIRIDQIIYVIKGLCGVFNGMKRVGVIHDDLHDGNIMLQSPSQDEAEKTNLYKVKAIDFGSVKSFETGTKKPIDDYGHFANHIDSMLNKIVPSYHELSPEEKYLFDRLIILVSRMREPDPTPRLPYCDPRYIWSYVSYEQERSRKLKEKLKDVKLFDPFEYLSADEIGNDELIVELFADNFPWYIDIHDASNTVLTGPRGCGKTMILKYMRFRTRLSSKKLKDKLKDDSFVGFFVSCQLDLFMKFNFEDIISDSWLVRSFLHYFNMLYLLECIDSIRYGLDEHVLELPIGFVESLQKFVENSIRESLREPFILKGTDILNVLVSLINKELRETEKELRNKKAPENQTPKDFLINLSKLIKEIPLFKGKRIFYLLDDYFEPRIPFEIQKSLNRVIFMRQDSHWFKISTVPYGIKFSDLDNNVFEKNREYREINLGNKYLALDDMKLKSLFISKIVNNRLRLANYTTTIEIILGESRFPLGTIGKSLKDETTRKQTKYYGFQVIVNLCSNDISAILDLMRTIFITTKSRNESINGSEAISPLIQHDAIFSFSREYLLKLKDIEKIGEKLFEIAQAFGYISQFKLYNKEVKRTEGGKTVVEPYELLRLEFDESASISPEAENMHKKLLRFGVFIDGGYNRSRRNVLSHRLFFRKIYVPMFHTTYVSRDSLTLSSKHYEYFLLDPSSFRKSYEEKPEVFDDKMSLEGFE